MSPYRSGGAYGGRPRVGGYERMGAAAAPPAYTSPLDFEALAAWYDAADTDTITDAGSGAVSEWNDKSGNSKHLTQGTAGSRPTTGTTTIGGLNSLLFGVDFMTNASITLGAFTVFAVTSHVGAGTTQILWEHSANSASNDGAYTNANLDATVNVRRGGTRSAKNAASNWLGASAAISVHYWSGTHAAHAVRKNGAPVSISSTGGHESDAGTAEVTAALSVGARSGGSLPYAGRLGELVFVNAALSTAQIQAEEARLAAKWGITLA